MCRKPDNNFDFTFPVLTVDSPAEFEAGVVRGRHGERSPLPGPWDVRQCRRATARWQLHRSRHPPARDHPPLLGPFPGQTGIRGVQRAAAHLALLHERPLFGRRRLARGRSTRIFLPQTAPGQELTKGQAGLLVDQISPRTPFVLLSSDSKPGRMEETFDSPYSVHTAESKQQTGCAPLQT